MAKRLFQGRIKTQPPEAAGHLLFDESVFVLEHQPPVPPVLQDFRSPKGRSERVARLCPVIRPSPDTLSADPPLETAARERWPTDGHVA
jgi:hypothetical protein